LNETLFIQSPVEEGERDIPKIMEITGNEIEARRTQHEDEQAETSQTMDHKTPSKKKLCFFVLVSVSFVAIFISFLSFKKRKDKKRNLC